jgi:membrane-bound inhibitor of C-type lysozyme
MLPLCRAAAAFLVLATAAHAADGTPRKNLAWDCERLQVVTSQETVEAIWLFLPEQTVKLPLVASASGAKYQGEGVMFWTKGTEQALLEHAGEAHLCSVDAARSVWEDAKLRGVDFRGVGNEPGWVLEIEPERLVFLYDYGTRRVEVPRPDPTTDGEAARTVYATEAEAWPFTITLSGEACRDVMSGEAFETTVEVIWGPQRFDGCGRSLH